MIEHRGRPAPRPRITRQLCRVYSVECAGCGERITLEYPWTPGLRETVFRDKHLHDYLQSIGWRRAAGYGWVCHLHPKERRAAQRPEGIKWSGIFKGVRVKCAGCSDIITFLGRGMTKVAQVAAKLPSLGWTNINGVGWCCPHHPSGHPRYVPRKRRLHIKNYTPERVADEQQSA